MKVVHLHLPACLSSLSDPACAGPCAYGGDVGLKEAKLAPYLVLLVAGSLKAHCSRDAHARACDGACGGGVLWRAPLIYPQQVKTHFYRTLHLRGS